MDPNWQRYFSRFPSGDGRITILTGAGISAESGIPTFRGPEGYWTVGSRAYHPQEMATRHMFAQDPQEVWRWYLYRLGVCAAARPNPGHDAVAAMEELFGDRFTLITQNIDNLHIRAGNSHRRTFQIHGNIFFMRCAADCTDAVFPLPAEIGGRQKGEPLHEADRRLLRCPLCAGRSRPHVLWFDESYDENHYRFYSSIEVARRTDLLIVVGTSGATNLPLRVAGEVFQAGGTIVNIDIGENPFSALSERGGRGCFIQQPSAGALNDLLTLFRQHQP